LITGLGRFAGYASDWATATADVTDIGVTDEMLR